MTVAMPSKIKSAKDLVTTHEATCQGFLDQAKLKTQKAVPHVAKAAKFWEALQKAKNASDLLRMSELRDAMVATAGVSAKALKYLTPEDIDQILQTIFKDIEKNARTTFREEIFYRYLLTRGDSLGGEMRNLAGAEGQRIFTRAVLLALITADKEAHVSFRRRATSEQADAALEMLSLHKAQAIEWSNRLMVFDKKPRIINKSVDVILFDTSRIDEPVDHYLACGELKGGIDPAGADEHWKTAQAALNRIRHVFATERHKPALFFVGGAIEEAMAKEIFRELKNGSLTRAANLTVPGQVSALASWLVAL